MMMALRAIETYNITMKTWPYLGPNFTIPNVPIRLRDSAENNDVEFSIRMMQLTRFSTKLLRQVAEVFSGLFLS